MTVIRNGQRRWVWPLLAGLAAILAVLLWLSPAEQTLGQTVKLVYLHGALVRTALVLFAISLPEYSLNSSTFLPSYSEAGKPVYTYKKVHRRRSFSASFNTSVLLSFRSSISPGPRNFFV